MLLIRLAVSSVKGTKMMGYLGALFPYCSLIFGKGNA